MSMETTAKDVVVLFFYDRSLRRTFDCTNFCMMTGKIIHTFMSLNVFFRRII